MNQSQYASISDIALVTGLSRDTVTRLFQSEPGVLVLATQTRFKRRYRTLRVPVFVRDRVLARLTVQGAAGCS